MQLTPYIIFNGNCEEALNFYAQALGGHIENLMRFDTMPSEGMSEADKKKILHSHFKAGDFFFMASDNGMGAGSQARGSGQVYLSINFEDKQQQEKVFSALGQGGNVIMPLNDTFWGATFGMLTDKFGINWMFNCENRKS